MLPGLGEVSPVLHDGAADVPVLLRVQVVPDKRVPEHVEQLITVYHTYGTK